MKSPHVTWSVLIGGMVVLTTLVADVGYVCAQETQPRESPSEQESVEPSEAQMALNDDGVRAMIEGDYAGAVSLLERSTRLGEVNVTYLNLGRAYQKLGGCAKARAALENAKTAPAVADPPAAEVSAVADEYLAELAESCDDQKAGDQAGANSVAVVDHSTSSNVLGWGTTISGGALVGGGLAMHFVAESKRAEVTDQEGVVEGVTQREAVDIEESADNYDTIGLAMGVGGGLLVALGTYLLLTDDAGAEQSPAEGASVWLGAGEAGISWTQMF